MLDDLVRKSGFAKRKPRKISAANLLGALFTECTKGSPSYNDLAASIADKEQSGPSRQAVCARINEDSHKLVESLLSHVMGRKTSADTAAGSVAIGSFRGWQRVLVQDSTIIQLPASLFDQYSGVSNGKSTVCNARIQTVFDLISARLVSFSVDPYSKNDLSAAPELAIRQGDLALRDRGYLSAAEIERHCDTAADYIYRHKTGAIYLDVETKLPVDVADQLRRHGQLDMEVLLNNTAATRVRLVARRVDEETANTRRMRAKKENKGHNPSAATLFLMSWTIYITSIPADKADFAAIFGIYGLRWRIEVIFKSWKSHLNFSKIHRVSKTQLTVLLKARLLVIAAATNLYCLLEHSVWDFGKARLSLLKLINYLAGNTVRLLRILNYPNADAWGQRAIWESLMRYCCYDKRQKRQNFRETMEMLA